MIIIIERPIHFESMRQTLEAAAKIGVEELYSACLKVKGMIEDNGFRLPVLESYESLSHLPTDEISKKLLPAEWKHVTPLQCLGDGNCLYRYESDFSELFLSFNYH